ncbi:hypothetical protein FBEOM_7121 [Fusarium beomiforme]|uniref:Heterokaryon incompatibility domain-containing protein n=1 Tax=Fusarium beomiforme TaxID=44412 RepID=A0A9P5AHN8_9HYPO|nr:hypothetical protein FBEOM_7121 [Fusarium beomiforme]
MYSQLRQNILSKTPNPQNESPLFSILPGEVRDSIFSYVLTDHPDPTPAKKFSENTCYTRPSYLAAQSTDTRLLRTCRAIYRETWYKPFLLREQTQWATSGDRAPPPSQAPLQLYSTLLKVAKYLGTDSVEIERLRVFAQMYKLEEGGLESILRMPHLAPRTVTLTIRHTDWWYWEDDEPLRFEGNWIKDVCAALGPSTTQFCIELESLERKKDQVDKIAKQMVDNWFFKRPDGVVLYADTSDANRKVSRWSGSSTWHGQRWIRDETEPNKLDYYIVSIKFRPIIEIERSGGAISENAIREARGPSALDRPKLWLPDQEKIETENAYEDVADSDNDGLPQPDSDNDDWYAAMEERYEALPHYATLSHTWDHDESTFQSFGSLDWIHSQPGFDKVGRACEIALSLNYEWLWADTVCIDKTDSDELNEAINSMFSWYQQSGVCLAYLSDVPTANISDTELLTSTTRIEDMAYCMLGIFDVKMPIIYGEGSKAMDRLLDIITDSEQMNSSLRYGLIKDESRAARRKKIFANGVKAGNEVFTKEYKNESRPQSSIHVLILGGSHPVRDTLRTRLWRSVTSRITAKSDDELDFEHESFDIIFRYSVDLEPQNSIISPSYCRCGSVQVLRRMRNVESLPKIEKLVDIPEVREHGRYHVFCRLHTDVMKRLPGKFERLSYEDENGFSMKYVAFPPPLEDIWKARQSNANYEQSTTMRDPRVQSKHPVIQHLEPVTASQASMTGIPESKFTYDQGDEGSEICSESPQSTTFDLTIQSSRTRPSTVPTSHNEKAQVLSQVSSTSTKGILLVKEEVQNSLDQLHNLRAQSISQDHVFEGNNDRSTIYSFDTLSDDPKLQYFQAFIDQLAEDVRADSGSIALKDLGPEFLGNSLREFAWKLHGESVNPFQLETSVIIHRKRRNIVDMLHFEVPELEIADSDSEPSHCKSDTEDDVLPASAPFRKADETIIDWIGDINPVSTSGLSQIPQYRQFIQGSNAYQWLLTKIDQHRLLSCEDCNCIHEIGDMIRAMLKDHGSLRKISRGRPSVVVEMTYSMEWDLFGYMKDSGIPYPFSQSLPDVLCLTGRLEQAQACTVGEYLDQTWPQTGSSLVTLLQKLLANVQEKGQSSGSSSIGLLTAKAEGKMLEISVTGDYYYVSEVGEQLGWIASALRPPPRLPHDHEGPVTIGPRIDDFGVNSTSVAKFQTSNRLRAHCMLAFSWGFTTAYKPPAGQCWQWLFCCPVLVRDYPILRRSVPQSGLEISLRYVAGIIGSQEVVQWHDRLLMKGFNMLIIASLVSSDVMVWHLLVSDEPEKRISYVDPRLNEIDSKVSDEMQLGYVEGKRHVIGWCTKATDFCGNATANQDIESAGLPRAPASTVIDKLYIEGGSPITAGLILDINKKEQPFWLQREKDYPGLLNWVKTQPVVFYDVEDRRAWLVNGASALLHLVRISLHRDANDPESAYDWVYENSKLKDHWPSSGNRQSAIQTLKNWDNRALSVYIIDKRVDASGAPITRYSTFEDRVRNILHSMEKLVDRQAKTASQDGIKISQSWDPRRDVVGFDILDIIDPSVPIYPRMQHLNSWGHGWIDLIPTVGITTIFGRGFGDLIRADEPNSICPSWRSVPGGKDFLTASFSTMQMLHEKRLLRMEPGLAGGDLTKKITWVAAKEATMQYNCIKMHVGSNPQASGNECNHNPVQFLAKRWWSRTVPHGLKPVHLGSLDPHGAIIFGHTILGLRTGDRSMLKLADDDGAGSSTSGDGSLQASASGSGVSQTTSMTVPSAATSSPDANVQQGPNYTSSTTDEVKKRWTKFRGWIRK